MCPQLRHTVGPRGMAPTRWNETKQAVKCNLISQTVDIRMHRHICPSAPQDPLSRSIHSHKQHIQTEMLALIPTGVVLLTEQAKQTERFTLLSTHTIHYKIQRKQVQTGESDE